MPLGWIGNSGAGVRRLGGVGVPNGVTARGGAPWGELKVCEGSPEP